MWSVRATLCKSANGAAEAPFAPWRCKRSEAQPGQRLPSKRFEKNRDPCTPEPPLHHRRYHDGRFACLISVFSEPLVTCMLNASVVDDSQRPFRACLILTCGGGEDGMDAWQMAHGRGHYSRWWRGVIGDSGQAWSSPVDQGPATVARMERDVVG
ncbi:hypothetical protein BKA80DRAFT_267309 [Phyllosticta citrichinensis]